MLQDTGRNNRFQIRKGMNNAEIQRIARHFQVSQNEVKERIEIVEMQRKMTQAFKLSRKALKN